MGLNRIYANLDGSEEELYAIPGTPPDLLNRQRVMLLHHVTRRRLKIDFVMEPPIFKVSDTHYAATWLLHADAPKVEPPEQFR